MHQDIRSDELKIYFQRLRPVLRELFAAAHAVCGNYETAEYVLQRTILEIYQRMGGSGRRVGFFDMLRKHVLHVACQEAGKLTNIGLELTWNGFVADRIEGTENLHPAFAVVAEEDLDVRRMVMLRYGCHLPAARIARIMDVPPRTVQSALDRVERRLRHRMSTRRARPENVLEKLAREQLADPTRPMPEPGTVFRSFEAEASSQSGQKKRVRKAAAFLLLLVLTVLCAGAFWLMTVLITPPQLENAENTAAFSEETAFEENNGFSAETASEETALEGTPPALIPTEALPVQDVLPLPEPIDSSLEPVGSTSSANTFFE